MLRLLQIAGMKKLLHRHFGYGDKPRLPLLPMDDTVADATLSSSHLQALLDLEATL